jgi:hypothetical protein
LIAFALAAAPGQVAAAEWQSLHGEAIAAALSARVLVYPGGATQNFFADGRTLYEAGNGPSWGRWRVDGDRYCSQWPPREAWDCYAVDREARGLDLRFVDKGGDATVGRYIDLK